MTTTTKEKRKDCDSGKKGLAANRPGRHAYVDEVRAFAVRSFPFEGKLIIKRLFARNGVERYRLNWHQETDIGGQITASRFVHAEKTDSGVRVVDRTIS